ncbi:hypothetical protein SK224_10935 [Microbacterium sp. BG28]|uniref:hypothetical protein n=1 Tax=Microbacterium sp. BG28 TaxID=3097356 RepID=UPI002A598D07|nr:hypothetical protein [Microbacterium sp. BG28]MDY0829634.1 hypothetical protein [Microbacterium sp. BG28]
MSGSRAKEERQAQRALPLRLVNTDAVKRSADAVLSVDLSDHKFRDRAAQLVAGLCRAGFAQSKVIATLARADLLSAAGPNRPAVAFFGE